jgi:hypothetical protein
MGRSRGRVAATVTAALCLALVPAASASQTAINTIDNANNSIIASFGNPNTATYGQVITAPEAVLTGFTFRVDQLEADVVFRGEVYAWDSGANRATGAPLFESKALTTSGTALQDVTVDTGSTSLTPGQLYVLFFTTSKDFEAGATNAGVFRRAPNTAYSGGDFVYLNNGTDEKLWTSEAWTPTGLDLQFRATFASAQQKLTIVKSGTGSGTVTSSGGGIDCGGICSGSFPFGSGVALQAAPAPGSVFAGFSGGGCSVSPCLLSMLDDVAVSAVFQAIPPVVAPDVLAPQTTIRKRRGNMVTFASSEANSTFTCKVDKSKAKACTSPFKLKKLKPGPHVFTVAATDAAGNTDASPAKLRFKVPASR